jgi:hypothetical protein
MRTAHRSHRGVLWSAGIACLVVVSACGGDDDDGDAAADLGSDVTTPADDRGAGGDEASSSGECSLVDIETVEELFGMQLELDVAEGFAGSALCNFNDTAEDTYSVLLSRSEVDGESQYDEAVAAVTGATPVDVGDEAVARSSDGDFGGSVDLYARQGDVYVSVSTTFGPEGSADAAIDACSELAALVL